MDNRDLKDNGSLRRPTRRTLVFIVTGSVVGSLLVLAGTLRYGPAVSPDSAMYVAAANSLLAGEGYLGYSGAPYAEKPPLYPTVLALGDAVGFDAMETAPILNAIVFGLITFCAGWLFFVRLRTSPLAWIGFFAILLSWPLLQVAMKVWSEPLFVLLTLLFIMYAPAALTRTTWSRITLLAIIAALATLQRYIGLALVITGIAMILSLADRLSLRRKLAYAVGFFFTAVGPFVAWTIRNVAVGSPLTGSRTVSTKLLIGEPLSGLVGTLTAWIFPPLFPMWMGILVGIVLAFAVTAGFLGGRRFEHQGTVILERVMLVFVLVYTLSVLCLSMVEAAAIPDNRILSPVYLPLVYLVLAGLERLTTRVSRHAGNTGVVRRVVVAVSIAWLLYPVASVTAYVSIRASYDTNAWHDSNLARWLEADLPEGRLYSNQAWVVYLFTERYTRRLPEEKDIEIYLARELEEHGEPCLVAWFYGSNRGRAHVARLLQDFLGQEAAREESGRIGDVAQALLDFMVRSGLASREGHSRSSPVEGASGAFDMGGASGPSGMEGRFEREETFRSRLPATNVRVVRSFDDGVLYVFPG